MSDVEAEQREALYWIEMLWDANPEQRLGQLLLNLTRHDNGSVDQHLLWNIGSEELARMACNAYLNRML